MGGMEQDLRYESLWQAAYKEKKSNELQILPKTFYRDMWDYIKSLKGTSEDPEITSNASKLLEELFERRKQKILIYVAYNKLLPQPVIDSEQKFYESILEKYKSEKLEQTVAASKLIEERLNVIKDIPEILLPSGKKIGPLKKGESIFAENEEDKEFLKTAEICSA
ncbi:MAG: hypothetical protein QXK65_03070 [Candidatus Micrarchaeaceae archaeon]